MPTTKDWIMAGIAGILFYILIYVFLYAIKYDVNLFLYSLIIWVLIYAASCVSPLVRVSEGWRRLFREK